MTGRPSDRVLEDALNHLLNAVSANALPDLLAQARREAEAALQAPAPVACDCPRLTIGGGASWFEHSHSCPCYVNKQNPTTAPWPPPVKFDRTRFQLQWWNVPFEGSDGFWAEYGSPFPTEDGALAFKADESHRWPTLQLRLVRIDSYVTEVPTW